MTSQRYEILVLGSGAGGKLLSWHMARAGHRTAVVERKWIGGSCPNINCLPSKNEIWSAKVADLVNHATAFGMVTGTTAIDMASITLRSRRRIWNASRRSTANSSVLSTYLQLTGILGTWLMTTSRGFATRPPKV